jgi:nicotinamide mononucleotide transporter
MSDPGSIENRTGQPLVLKWQFAIESSTFALVGAGLVVAWFQGWTSSSPTEVFGFISGGLCVWLGVRQSIWTWPVGLANFCAFFVLFARARLFADATLQVVFFSLSVYGWWTWSKAGSSPARPSVTRARRGEWLFLTAVAPLTIWGLFEWLVYAKGASPFWDAVTTALSLAAQFLMCRKRLENWLIWILADLIYVPLYIRRGLPLTAVLYLVFLMMCVAGWSQWKACLISDRPGEGH